MFTSLPSLQPKVGWFAGDTAQSAEATCHGKPVYYDVICHGVRRKPPMMGTSC